MKKTLSNLVVKRTKRDYLIYTFVILIGVFLDQLTKFLAVKYLEPVVDVPIIDGVLHLHFHLNPGAAFGSFADKPYIFNTLSVLIIVGMLLYLYLGHAESTLSGVASAMIVSGGIGNMIDRVIFGEVTDFIYFKLINFAIFNGADSFVCVGAGLLVLALILEIKEEYAKQKQNKAKKEEGSTDQKGDDK